MSYVSGQEFSLMEHILQECTKRSFKATLKEWEERYDFNTIQKSVIEKLKIKRNIK